MPQLAQDHSLLLCVLVDAVFVSNMFLDQGVAFFSRGGPGKRCRTGSILFLEIRFSYHDEGYFIQHFNYNRMWQSSRAPGLPFCWKEELYLSPFKTYTSFFHLPDAQSSVLIACSWSNVEKMVALICTSVCRVLRIKTPVDKNIWDLVRVSLNFLPFGLFHMSSQTSHNPSHAPQFPLYIF